MSNILKTLATGSASEPTDEYFNQTTLLLHGDGTNGAQNNTFLDSSTNNFTITRNGNTTQGTFSPFSNADGEWSIYGTGTSYLTVPNNAVFSLPNDFTIEFWTYINTLSNNDFFTIGDSASANNGLLLYYSSSGGGLVVYSNTGAVINGSAPPAKQWVHIALVRNGGGSNNLKLYIDGTQSGQATNTTTFTGVAGNGVAIAGQYFSGSMGSINNQYTSNFRIVKGRAVYTSAFTPPTSPLGATSGGEDPPQGTETSLLTCQSNRYVDNSNNNFTITANGNTSVQPFSPFLPSAAYSPSVNGGSGYFDGSGDYLQVPAGSAWDFGTGAFTMEMWVYPALDEDNAYKLFSINQNGSNQWEWSVTTFLGWGIYWYWGNYGSNQTEKYTGQYPIKGQWNHVVVCRDASYTWRFYLNGVLLSTSLYEDGTTWSDSRDFNNTSINPRIGENFKGHISDVMITKGASLYSGSTISLPTAPLTAVSGTELLLLAQNAGILDNTGKNNLETVGNAQIDTTTKKYGTGSIEFDGTGDYLFMSATPNLTFGNGDFTWEAWIYPNSLSGTLSFLYGGRPAGTNGAYPVLFLTSSATTWYVDSASRIAGAALSTGQWSHLVVCRSGSSTKMFINGVQTGSTYTDTTNYLLSRVYVGTSDYNSGTSEYFNGFIDDLRITKGVARYTTTFTPPSRAFPDQ